MTHMIMNGQIVTYDEHFSGHDYEMIGGMNIARKRYDWMFTDDSNSVTPEQNRYAYDAHYLWRDFADKTDIPPHDSVYTDRMRQWDYEKYEAAFDRDSTEFGKLGNLGSWGLRIQRRDAQIIVKRYFGEDAVCIGYGIDTNRSTGYELGIFLVQRTKHIRGE